MNDFRDCVRKEEELEELEHVFRSMASHSQSSEQKLKEMLQQLSEVTLAKLELAALLEAEKRETYNLQAQLNLCQSTMKEWEQERANTREATLKQNIHFESVTNERNSLAENIKKLQIENMELKMNAETHAKVVENHKKLENVLENHKSSMNSLYENIFTQHRKLEIEQNSLKKTVKSSMNVGQFLLQLLEQHHNVLNDALAEIEDLKESRNRLSSELAKIRENNSVSRHSIDEDKDEMTNNSVEKCEAMIMSLNKRIEEETEQRRKLNELLKSTLNEQITFFESNENMKERILELEKTIESYTKAERNCPSGVDEATQTGE